MKRIVINIDGKRYVLTKDKKEKNLETCHDCVFKGSHWCGAMCNASKTLAGIDGDYHFEEEVAHIKDVKYAYEDSDMLYGGILLDGFARYSWGNMHYEVFNLRFLESRDEKTGAVLHSLAGETFDNALHVIPISSISYMRYFPLGITLDAMSVHSYFPNLLNNDFFPVNGLKRQCYNLPWMCIVKDGDAIKMRYVDFTVVDENTIRARPIRSCDVSEDVPFEQDRIVEMKDTDLVYFENGNVMTFKDYIEALKEHRIDFGVVNPWKDDGAESKGVSE